MQVTPQKIINKQILKQKPTIEDFLRFKNALQKLQNAINPNESEEHNKDYIKTFLQEAFYSKTNLVNTADRIDCAHYPIEYLLY